MARKVDGICEVCGLELSWENHGEGAREGYRCDDCGCWLCPDDAFLVGVTGPVYCVRCL